ncbi:CpsD/CapB family tyrosine-protein kinase [Paenibacillus lycopersici]|uniref:CpsD/CapB family tyrosine-protein kinase n=1 Tax=Paenibacillus lycopersici TaxID=2704462 RepID=A0A6C0FWQ9_9BACL|nr:CpsD/CapB family tyrosine-protein kinase [Paenibacillus lycopersici]QHT59911.1 CpsD/CapB family tyrosine-protein kinase [Paenibacillus lycopersici]
MPTTVISKSNRLITELNPRSSVPESYRLLKANIEYSSSEETAKCILVTSMQSESSKAITISNLAIVYALEGKSVLVIDADLYEPSLDQVFSSNGLGLSNVLDGHNLPNDVISETHISNISFVSTGQVSLNSFGHFTSERMRDFLSVVKSQFDIVLITSPPVLDATEASVISALCDGTVLVIEHAKVKREAAQKAISQLNKTKCRLLGAVLVNAPVKKKTKN